MMSSLYNNKNQESEFHLLQPRKISTKECNDVKKAFQLLDCDHSFVIAEQTPEFNCIGWGIGVRAFIDPTREINPHYNTKQVYDTINGHQLYRYNEDKKDCMQAVAKFFDAYKERSVLPQKQYKAVSDIDHPPQDDTIAFYFLSWEEGLKPNEGRGFTHAARYVEDVNSWVSDMWTSKLGKYKLITHGEDDLNDSIYGNPLCYLVHNLVPKDFCKIKTDIFKFLQMCEFEDEYDIIPEVNILANIVDEQQDTMNTE